MGLEKPWFARIQMAVSDVVTSMTEDELLDCTRQPIRFPCPEFTVNIKPDPVLPSDVEVVFGHPVDRLTLPQLQRIFAVASMHEFLDEIEERRRAGDATFPADEG